MTSTTQDFLSGLTLAELERDPYPSYARLRREAPVAFVPAAGVWFVTDFDTCAAVGEGRHGFIGAEGHPTVQRVFGSPDVLTSGGETHEDLRRGIDPSLQPGPVNDMVDALVRPVAREHLARLAIGTNAELMADYFEPVSVEALRSVMGLDGLVDSATLRRWFHDLNLGVANFGQDPEVFRISDAASAEIEAVVRPHLEHLREHPDESMMSHMLWAGREGGDARDIDLLLPSIKVILLGGMQEPGHAAGSALLGLLGDADQLRLLRDDPEEYIPLAVNEGMRWIAPIGAVERQASVDVELHGQLIRAGEVVQVILGSANRDETRYDEPDRFDLLRSTRTHQAFGNGEHFCAGHFFARHVQRIMLEELIPALPGLTLDPDREPVVSGWVFRAPKLLPVRWQPATAPTPSDDRPRVSAGTAADERLELVVESMRLEADDVISLGLASVTGEPLPRWEPGAHVDLWMTPQRAGQYSLSGDPADRTHWRVAVLREPFSTGVSAFVHDQVRVGQHLTVGGPRNTFALTPSPAYTFVAGGIGVTPMLPMLRAALAGGADVEFAYCGRSRSAMAFLAELEGGTLTPALHIVDEGTRADLAAIVRRSADRRAVVYACGPTRMLDDLAALTETEGVEFVAERFVGVEAHRDGDRPFDILLARHGGRIAVPADRTALDVLREHGVDVRHACGAGNCGSCETRVLNGAVDHRDVLLSKRQRAAGDRMMVCVSRAAGDELTLDL